MLVLGFCLAAGVTASAADVVVPGVLKHEFFPGATRATVEDGTAGDPSTVGAITKFELPTGVADNYTRRVSGFFIPPTTGNYVFFVAADDDADLFLSTDETPANKRLIAQETQWSNNLQWLNTGDGTDNAGDPSTKRSDVTFGTLSLTAGTRYYIEGVQHEGGGGDVFSATFKLESEDDPANGTATALTGSVIAANLPAGTVTITTQPQSVTTVEGSRASFSVASSFTGIVGPTYQWQKNGADIAGATSTNYTTPVLALSDNGAKYTVKATVPGAEQVSAEATLTVNADNVPPTLVSVGALRHGTDVDVGVIFSEAVDPATVVAANFSLSSGTISSVRHITNSSGYETLESGAIVTATGLTPGSSYTLSVTGVKDVKGNAMAASQESFVVSSMTWVALGNDPPEFPAGAIATGTNSFNVNSGGNAFWNTTDDVTFVYEEVTGDFDKVLRVEYQDASSQWARAGIHARDSLGSLEAEAARYQNSHANPTIMANGSPSNYSFETNRRLSIGGATTGSNGGGTPLYPNAWVRLRRAGDVIHMYRSDDAVTWVEFNASNFNPDDGSLPDGPLPAKMFVGAVYGPENGNLTEEFRKNWTARFADYGDYQPNKGRGTQTYSIGINFQDDTFASSVGPMEVAGVNAVAQSNWNNPPAIGSSAEPFPLVADVNGAAQNSSATVEWTSPNTWGSTGRGEENNMLTGSDHALLAGYLDTGNATTTQVTIHSIPSQLTGGYDVIVYANGGVPNRGGAYRVTDGSGTELRGYVAALSPTAPTGLVRVVPGSDPAVHVAGNYIVFTNLTANEIIIEATTETMGASDAPRAPINAVQLISPTGLLDQVSTTPTISIARSATSTAITYTGRLQSADTVNGTYTDVAGATSPYTVTTSGTQKYYRSAQ